MKKISKVIPMIVGINLPLLSVLSCGEKNNLKNLEGKDFEVKIDFSLLKQKGWENYGKLIELSKSKEQTDPTMLDAYQYDENSFGIKTLVSKEINNEKHFSQLLTSKRTNGQAISYVSIFPKGSKCDLTTSNKGLTNWEKINEQIGSDKYRFASNIQSCALNEGGLLDIDLLIKNGVIYNIPTLAIKPDANVRIKTQTEFALAQKNDGSFSYIRNIPDTDNSLFKLKINRKDSSLDAIEKKGVKFFDIQNGKGIDTSRIFDINGNPDANNMYFKVDYKSPLDYIKEDEIRVIDEYQKDQKTPFDLSDSSLHAYLVEATEKNGITTIDNDFFSDSIDIIQAPFKGKILHELDKNIPNIASYVVPSGKALIVVKGEKNKFKDNEELSVDYELDSSNPISKEFKDIKWATTSKDYLANRGPVLNHVEDGDKEEIGAWVSNASWVLRNGVMPYLLEPNGGWVTVNFSYFIEMENGDFGIASFTKNPFNDNVRVSGNQFVQYLRTLGVKNAVALDGGGSVQQLIKNNNDWVAFPKSADAGGYRPLPSALAIGGIYE